MNRDIFGGNWKQFTGKVKEKWGELTDDDLQAIDGKEDQLVGRLQEKYGYSRERAQQEADDFERNMG
ncbi:CsbD family protein [soil metagenome]